MTDANKKPVISIINLVLFAAVVLVNTLAVTLPINGKSTGELSDKYPNLFVPAGFTFSIWGLIYVLLLIFVGYQLYISFGKKTIQKLNIKSQLLFGITCLLNIGWILAWHYELVGLSVIIMLTFLSSLILMFLENEKIRNKSFTEKITIETPINVYLGWISVATIANITAWLVTLGWTGGPLTESQSTLLMLIVGGLLAATMLFRKSNYAFALVIIWAYYGIYSKRHISENPEIATMALLIIVLITILMLSIVFRSGKKNA